MYEQVQTHTQASVHGESFDERRERGGFHRPVRVDHNVRWTRIIQLKIPGWRRLAEYLRHVLAF